MSFISARHILVDSKEECDKLIEEIKNGAKFEDLAEKSSKCPSGKKGGSLGTFGKGQMVPEFDKACFEGKVGELLGPIKTDFGFHVLEVTEKLASMPEATVRHILVKSEEECKKLIEEIKKGSKFADLAAKHSDCPSGKDGGSLGTFGKGQMVPEFEEASFNGAIGEIQGPVKTDFGFHVIEVTDRK